MSVFLYLHLLQNALALLDLYSQVSLSLQNPTPSRLRVRNMEVDSSYSYYACRGHVGPCVQCPSQWGK